jgi:hypothetical protein
VSVLWNIQNLRVFNWVSGLKLHIRVMRKVFLFCCSYIAFGFGCFFFEKVALVGKYIHQDLPMSVHLVELTFCYYNIPTLTYILRSKVGATTI